MTPIVECIPNFSEARRPEVVDQIVAAASVPGVKILDRSSDLDHNRTVLTFAGSPDAVETGRGCGRRRPADQGIPGVSERRPQRIQDEREDVYPDRVGGKPGGALA